MTIQSVKHVAVPGAERVSVPDGIVTDSAPGCCNTYVAMYNAKTANVACRDVTLEDVDRLAGLDIARVGK